MHTEAESNISVVSSADVAQTLGAAGGPSPRRKTIFIAVAIAIVGAAGAWFFLGRGDAKATKYITQEVTRGPITVTVTATGNLQPRNQVDIGSELSGTMRTVNVDVNDEVKVGQVLASLDTARLRAQVLQSESSLASALARVTQSEASAKESRANYQRLLRLRELSGNKLPSQQDLDVAEAAVSRAEGETVAAKAAVSQARANLETIRTDLGKAEIRSPINGVVLVRAVEPGQTVAASLQAPILFVLAEDLKKMELHVSVDEADVGSVEMGQAATFGVDAFPNRTFRARITQVHFASNNTQKAATSNSSSSTSTGVVTYETVLEVDNSELLLRPGMTATAQIVTTNIDDAVLIPNAALRFTPEGVQFPGPGGGGQRQQNGPLGPLMPQMNNRPRFGPNREGGQQGGMRRFGRAWIVENGQPELVMFRPGATDGRMTQVLELGPRPNNGRFNQMASDERFKKAFERKLTPGMRVIVDTETSKAK